MKTPTISKEISWLAFNDRVLQEAADPNVPLIERLKFLGIFSSNLDEFFRVRVATLKRLSRLGKQARSIIGQEPAKVLNQIHEQVLNQQAVFERLYDKILKELAKHKIFILNEQELNPAQAKFVLDYFRREVRANLVPIMIDQIETFPTLKDNTLYLATKLIKSSAPEKFKYVLIRVPTSVLPRFVILPKSGGMESLILLDDVIRLGLVDIFAAWQYDRYEAYTIKLTRDAELEFDDDFSESLMKKVSKGLSQRKKGDPVRFVFDAGIPGDFLKFLVRKMNLDTSEGNFIPGGRYHNFRDFINFPAIGAKRLRYKPMPPLPHPAIKPDTSIFKTLNQQDVLLHYPYQRFEHVIDLLREAAIDPKVSSIKITIYRLAKKSRIINALITAAQNGKSVTVVMELQARFDEKANIYWSNKLQEGGVRVIHGTPNYKVHCKLILITRKSKRKTTYYASIGTGNFNEITARIYTDHALLTSDPRLTKEVISIFDFLENKYQLQSFRHLWVSPFNSRQKINKLITQEIKNVQAGKEAYILIKMNNLTDPKLINKLYKASQAGVKIRMVVRGMFTLLPGKKKLSENIEAISIVDKFLEHTRFFIFCNDGDEKYFLTSADWMPRNLDRRVEVTCPIYDPEIRQQLRKYIDVQLSDTVKARELTDQLDNCYVPQTGRKKIRTQVVLYNWFKEMAKTADWWDGRPQLPADEEPAHFEFEDRMPEVTPDILPAPDVPAAGPPAAK